ncbi:MAG: family 10 glycosylhydrolase [Clostridiales bacterium]|nr:family 10 glycosylhydrolase [Clostridiales bacterium]
MRRTYKRTIPLILAALVALFSSCGAETVSSSLSPLDGSSSDSSISGYSETASELRGVYITTAYNLNFPSRAGESAAELAAELDAIVENAVLWGMNTIIFQARAESDALYSSEIFPTSAYLVVNQGDELPDGFDPLEYLVTAAHAVGIDVYAWLNPLRVTRGGSAENPKTDLSALAETNPARQNPELTYEYAGELYYDPGLPEVRELIADGVYEVVANYDIDGVLFDDYFYPYPEASGEVDENGDTVYIEIDDADTYALYGDGADIDDWRRENVNLLIEACYNAAKSADADCKFGISPFGIWQNDDGENGGSDTSGFEAYSSLYCDALSWAEGGYVDFLAPQIYWSFDKSSAAYDVLANWWNAQLDGTGVTLYISHGVYKYGTDEWSAAGVVDEITAEIEYARQLISYRGSMLYGYAALAADTDGVSGEVTSCFADEILYSAPISTGAGVNIISHDYGEYLTLETVKLTGTSDPAYPVTCDGKKVSRRRDGSFYVTVTLADGENFIEFMQNGSPFVLKLYHGSDFPP